MADERASDKAPLSDYVESVARQYLEAVAAIEKAYPEWEVGAATIMAKAALKPVTKDGKTTVWVDIDEGRNVQIADIPIPLAKRNA